MAELKIGGSDVSKIYYKDKDVSGSQMLEAGTIIYQGRKGTDLHLPNVLPNWSNVSDKFSISFINGYTTDGQNFTTATTEIINKSNLLIGPVTFRYNSLSTTVSLEKENDTYIFSIASDLNGLIQIKTY